MEASSNQSTSSGISRDKSNAKNASEVCQKKRTKVFIFKIAVIQK